MEAMFYFTGYSVKVLSSELLNYNQLKIHQRGTWMLEGDQKCMKGN